MNKPTAQRSLSVFAHKPSVLCVVGAYTAYAQKMALSNFSGLRVIFHLNMRRSIDGDVIVNFNGYINFLMAKPSYTRKKKTIIIINNHNKLTEWMDINNLFCKSNKKKYNIRHHLK
jgi:hypothetical protein